MLLQSKTVICCFVKETENLEVIACGAGTKSIPKKDYNEYALKDMHAEVLAHRALIRYLIKSPLKQSDKLHMFITRTPCGDASLVQTQSKLFWTGAKAF